MHNGQTDGISVIVRSGSPSRPTRSASIAWAYLGVGAAMAVALVALRDSGLAALPVAVMGVAATVAATAGRIRNRPQVGYPWAFFAAACLSFIVGAVLRQLLAGQPLAPVADVATLAGYAATMGGFVGLLRSRQSIGRTVHELVDGAVLFASVTALALVLFTLPTVEHLGLSVTSVVQGAYPVVDALMIFTAILLSWTSASRVPSFWLLCLAVVSMLVGDVGYAWIGTRGQTVGSPLLDLPFVIAFSLFGAAALHPSMRQLSAIQIRPVQAWSGERLMLLATMLLVPPIIVVQSGADADWIASVAGVVCTMLLLVRAVTAVHDHARAQERLRVQAAHDPLTGLPNRWGLVELVDGLLERAELSSDDEVDLLFLDLDSFKFVNDTWGHAAGDRLLNLAADRLRAVAHPTDVVARIGGDEFVVARYVGGHGSPTGEMLAAEILDAFRQPLSGDDVFGTTVSIGIASTRSGGGMMGRPSTESLLRDADTAMYRAKAAGRNRCLVFDPSMHDSVRRRVETELALRYALERHELLLHYQPVVSVQTGEVVGAEALLRWAHPGMGMVSPLDFIPVAEETGLIVEIGEWVVSEALRQLARWREERAGLGLPELWMAVNISARQLRDPSLVDHVSGELARYGVPAEQLVLEITETAMMADEELATGLLERLRTLGVTLAVDDFGTGYSSLGHLRRYPVTKVKIDRAFVAGIEDDADDAEIVRAVVAMSLAMRLEVVAEGIETAGQRDMLQQIGVQLGQGWFFGRPQPAEDCQFVRAQPARLKS
jgi:diguanylate cyclase (GGDEF)-like protein